VLTGGEVRSGELIRLELVLGDEIAPLWGHVIYQVREIGFAARFVLERDADMHRVNRLIAGLQQ
jgi:hypothetical protein